MCLARVELSMRRFAGALTRCWKCQAAPGTGTINFSTGIGPHHHHPPPTTTTIRTPHHHHTPKKKLSVCRRGGGAHRSHARGCGGGGEQCVLELERGKPEQRRKRGGAVAVGRLVGEAAIHELVAAPDAGTSAAEVRPGHPGRRRRSGRQDGDVKGGTGIFSDASWDGNQAQAEAGPPSSVFCTESRAGRPNPNRRGLQARPMTRRHGDGPLAQHRRGSSPELPSRGWQSARAWNGARMDLCAPADVFIPAGPSEEPPTCM